MNELTSGASRPETDVRADGRRCEGAGGVGAPRRRHRCLLAVLAATILAAGCSGESPQALMASAKEQLSRNDTSAAVIQLKNVLQQAPDSAEARFLLGKTLLELDDPAGAAVELRKARSLGHPDEMAVPLLARSLVAQGQLKAVADEFADVHLSSREAEADLQVTLATAYAGRKLQELSEGAVKAALAAQPKHAGAMVMQSRLLAVRGDLGAAMEAIDATLQVHPQDASAWVQKGNLLVATGADLDAALDAYRKAVAADARNLDAHYGALSILVERNDPALLQPQLDVLAKAYPEHRLTRYFQAQVANQRRDFDAARRLLQPLLASSPDDVQLLLLAGAVEFQAGAYLQAETFLAKAVQSNPSLMAARRLLVQTHLRNGQGEKALAAAQPALSAPRPDARMLAMAAEAYLLSGDLKKASELFNRAAKLDPQDLRSRTAVALAEVLRGNAAVGLRQLEALAEQDKGSSVELALVSAHLQRGEFEAAMKSIAALQRKRPDHPFAHFLRGRVQLLMKKPEDGRRSFEQALAVDPVYFPAAAHLAALDMADGKSDAARARFEAILAKEPTNVAALLALAEVTEASGGPRDEVTRLLNEAVKADPRQPRPRVLLVEHLVRVGDLRGAMSAAQEGVAALPTSWQLLDALGRVQLASGDANQAIASFTKVAGMQPESAEPQLRLAAAYLANGDDRAARQALGKALGIRPDLVQAQRQLIELEVSAGRMKQAAEIMRTVQQQRPAQAVGHILQGDIEFWQRNYGAAESAYRVALAREAANSEAAAKLHGAMTVAGKKAEAGRWASSWLKEHPKDFRFLSQLGDQAMARRDYADAEEMYRQALDASPSNATMMNNVAWVLARQGKPGAVDLAEKANALSPDQPAFIDTLAFALSTSGQTERAIELQKSVISRQPGVPSYRLNLAKIYIKAGRKADAETELNELAKLGDRFVGQAEVARLQKSLKDG